MLSQKLQDAINAQINAEFWSAYLYLSLSMDAASQGLKGISNWFAIQFKEEQDHAQILINYLNSRNSSVVLAPIAKVQTEWATPLAMYEDTLAQEKQVTEMINKLFQLADDEKDIATKNMLVWFVDEQVEEEENAREIIDQLKMVEGNKFGLYMIDKEMGARTYSVAAPLASNE